MSQSGRHEVEEGSDANDMRLECKYWVAVNGDSAAASAIPFPRYPTVMPTPQLLVGFDSREEQLRCQRFLLTGPLDAVSRYKGVTLPRLARQGKVVLKAFRFPGKTTRGQTLWTYEGAGV